jgi:radical SAM protein with 4Fe4S-binding SPASM domain
LVFKQEREHEKKIQLPIILEIEEGVDWERIESLFSNVEIREILYFGENYPGDVFPGVPVQIQKKDFSKCISRSSGVGKFSRVDENFYRYSREYNNCWGRKIALTRDGKIRPCIYSEIELGVVDTALNSREIIDKAWKNWLITMDMVDKCKECEFRYICPDCREIAFRSGGTLHSPNPYCRYDPHSGTYFD